MVLLFFLTLRAFIFDKNHCLVNLYQVCSNGGLGTQNGPAAGGFGFKSKTYSKSSSAEPLSSGAGYLVYSIAWWSFTKFIQMVAPGLNWPYARESWV